MSGVGGSIKLLQSRDVHIAAVDHACSEGADNT